MAACPFQERRRRRDRPCLFAAGLHARCPRSNARRLRMMPYTANFPQQRLYFNPEPHGQAALRAIFLRLAGTAGADDGGLSVPRASSTRPPMPVCGRAARGVSEIECKTPTHDALHGEFPTTALVFQPGTAWTSCIACNFPASGRHRRSRRWRLVRSKSVVDATAHACLRQGCTRGVRDRMQDAYA